MLIHLRLVKAGLGSLNEVREFDARTVLQALFYEGFCDDYEKAFWELNK
jgi:hypothetical protein